MKKFNFENSKKTTYPRFDVGIICIESQASLANLLFILGSKMEDNDGKEQMKSDMTSCGSVSVNRGPLCYICFLYSRIKNSKTTRRSKSLSHVGT